MEQSASIEAFSVLFSPDTLVRIFSHSSIVDLEQAVLVCRTWYQIASEHFIWNGFGLKAAAAPSVKVIWIKDWEWVGHKTSWDMQAINRLAAIEELSKITSREGEGLNVCGIVPKGLTLRQIQGIAATHWVVLTFFTPRRSPDEFIDIPLANTCIIGLKGEAIKRFTKRLDNCEEPSIIPATALAVLIAIRDKMTLFKTPVLFSEQFDNRILSLLFREKENFFQLDNLLSCMGFGERGAQVTLK